MSSRETDPLISSFHVVGVGTRLPDSTRTPPRHRHRVGPVSGILGHQRSSQGGRPRVSNGKDESSDKRPVEKTSKGIVSGRTLGIECPTCLLRVTGGPHLGACVRKSVREEASRRGRGCRGKTVDPFLQRGGPLYVGVVSRATSSHPTLERGSTETRHSLDVFVRVTWIFQGCLDGPSPESLPFTT